MALSPQRRILTLLLSLLALTALSACVEDNPLFDPDPVNEENALTCERGREISQVVSTFEDPTKLDVLFVVSNAPGAAPLQQRLSSAVPRLISILEDQKIDYQIGTIGADTRNTAQAGRLLTGGVGDDTCADAPRIITPEHGGQAGGFAACNMLVGTNGSHIQEPLEAATLALTQRATEPAEINGNAGFLRPRARLMVLFATDRDDCSNENATLRDTNAEAAATDCTRASNLSATEDFVSMLRALKTNQNTISVGLIGGSDDGRDLRGDEVLPPTCKDASGADIYPATRLLDVVEQLSPQSDFESACAASYGVSIARLGQLAEPSPIEVCPSTEITDPDVSVNLLQGDQRTGVEEGASGFLYLGSTSECSNGTIQISHDTLSGEDGRIELRYCTR